MATLTLEERKERVNELRKAHFKLGFEQGSEISDYKENYTEKGLNKKELQRPNPDAVRFEEYRKNPRKTHYELGTDEGKSLYSSIAQESFKETQAQEKAQLSETVKNDLRSHHFVLGYHSVDDPSEYKREFLKKQQLLQTTTDKKEMQTFLRKHNHDFGDHNNYYNTTYDVQHNQQYDKDFLKQALNKEDLREKTLEIRRTNIKIGNQKQDYVTQNKAVFGDKQTKKACNQNEKFLKDSHMVLGTEQPEMNSVNSTTYRGQQPLPQERIFLNKDQLRDFRATHFDLALQKDAQPETTHKSHFVSTGINALSALQKPMLQATHFYIDQGLTNKEYLDTYVSAYQGGIGKGVPLEIPDIVIQKRISSVVLGSDEVSGDNFISESQGNYLPYLGAERAKLDDQVKKNLRKHHFALGEDITLYETHNSQYNSVGPKTTLDDKTMKDLRGHHFKYGNSEGNYYQHSCEIGSKQGPPNFLNSEKQKDLRAHHFKEEGESNYQTSYQVQTRYS